MSTLPIRQRNQARECINKTFAKKAQEASRDAQGSLGTRNFGDQEGKPNKSRKSSLLLLTRPRRSSSCPPATYCTFRIAIRLLLRRSWQGNVWYDLVQVTKL